MDITLSLQQLLATSGIAVGATLASLALYAVVIVRRNLD